LFDLASDGEVKRAVLTFKVKVDAGANTFSEMNSSQTTAAVQQRGP